jgi:hypothetical protein
MPLILNNVSEGAICVTDGFASYDGQMMREHGITHDRHDHALFDIGDSASIESLWNKIKREIASHYSSIPRGDIL